MVDKFRCLLVVSLVLSSLCFEPRSPLRLSKNIKRRLRVRGGYEDISNLAKLDEKNDAELGLWCLAPDRSESEIVEGAKVLLERSEADVLALVMAAWGLASRRAFDVKYRPIFQGLAQAAAPKIHQLASLPRGPEAITNTARAFAMAVAEIEEFAPVALFSALQSTAAPLREKFLSDQFTLLSRSLATAKAHGLVIALPFGDACALPTARAVHASLEESGAKLIEPGPNAKQTQFKACLIPEFCTEIEAQALMSQASWQRSLVHGVAASRTSDTAVLARGSPIVDAIATRAAAFFGLPRSCCESLQLVRYRDNTHFYLPHLDLLDSEDQLLAGGQRLATVLLYLTTIPKGAGGATRIHSLDANIQPVAGTALAWCNVDPDGLPDFDSKHAALPLTMSSSPVRDNISTSAPPLEKICVNCWIRAFPGASEL